MKDEKPYHELLEESFTKTRDEIYAEAPRGQRIAYWIFVAIVAGFIGYIWGKKFGWF